MFIVVFIFLFDKVCVFLVVILSWCFSSCYILYVWIVDGVNYVDVSKGCYCRCSGV